MDSTVRFFKTSKHIIALSLVLLLPLSTQADEKAQLLIEKMSNSAKTQDYKGFFTFERGSQSRSYFFAHKVEADKEHQRLVFMDGQPLEIIRKGHSLKCIHPGGKRLNAEHAHLESLANLGQATAGVWAHYSADIMGEQRIAGRQTTQVVLKPTDQHRYPFVFNVDNETGVMVKMLVLDLKGRPLERFHFVNLEVDGVTDADLSPAIDGYHEVEHEAPASPSINTSDLWQLAWVPAGFEQESATMKPWGEPHKGQVFMYSDGLTAFSVFVDAVDAGNQATSSKRMGSTSAVSHYLNGEEDTYLVTVVGEIPLSTAQQIAAAVRFK